MVVLALVLVLLHFLLRLAHLLFEHVEQRALHLGRHLSLFFLSTFLAQLCIFAHTLSSLALAQRKYIYEEHTQTHDSGRRVLTTTTTCLALCSPLSLSPDRTTGGTLILRVYEDQRRRGGGSGTLGVCACVKSRRVGSRQARDRQTDRPTRVCESCVRDHRLWLLPARHRRRASYTLTPLLFLSLSRLRA